MESALTLIGFGEAGHCFATSGDWSRQLRVFDIAREQPAMRERLADAGVQDFATLAQALAGSAIAISLVTADQALIAAKAVAAAGPLGGLLFCDLNSVAPQTKQAAAQAIEAAGGRYVDVAVMSPVYPARLNAPLLVSGPHAQAGATHLSALGFTQVTIAGSTVGAASATKMVRSVMVKGIEALTAEMMLAARAGGVIEGVLASLGGDWADKADYNLDRMLAHGTRRAAEMEEVAATLEGFGIPPLMTRGTIARQRALGALLAGGAMPEGLDAKLDFITTANTTDAEQEANAA